MGALYGHLGAEDEQIAGAMARALAHRRPAPPRVQRAGLWWSGTSHATSRDGRVHCVLDGRLFNADELAEGLPGVEPEPSDAALVAELFAATNDQRDPSAILARLDGAFALAVATADQLTVARDPLGERPMYSAWVGDELVFASEIKALLAHPGLDVEPDRKALPQLLVFSFLPGRRTMFRGVEELPPGHALTVSRVRPRAVAPRDYFALREAPPAEGGDEVHVDAVKELTRDAVRRRLADHPAGSIAAFLSGGIDSSAVVAVLAKLGVGPRCYSIAFGHGQPNELTYARMVAQRCGVEHEVMDVTPEMFVDRLPAIIYALDDPLCDCITVPNFLLAERAAEHARVVFNGEGGDPLYGGPKNKFLILGEWYRFLGDYDRIRAYLASYHKFYDYLDALCTPELRPEGDEDLRAIVRPFLADDEATMRSFLNRLMAINIRLKGGHNILVKVDKMLAAHGVEPASPLFDRRLTEHSFALRPTMKRRDDVEKFVFKKAMEDLLPRPVVYRKKAGMGVPLSYWFKKTVLRDYAHDLLLSSRAQARGYFQRDFVESLLAGRGAPGQLGRDRSGELCWMLLAIELWHRVYLEGERP